MSAELNGTAFGAWSQRGRLALVHPSGGGLPPEELWDLHGSALFALACALVGDEPTALHAVTWAMADLYSHFDAVPDIPQGEALREAAECLFMRCHAVPADTHVRRTMILPPLMVLLGEIACEQRGALALCAFGGHSYRGGPGAKRSRARALGRSACPPRSRGQSQFGA